MRRTEREHLKSVLGATRACLTVEQLAGLLDRSLSGTERADAAMHIARCLRCQAEMSLLREFRSGEPRPEEVPAVDWIVQRLDKRSGEIFRPAAPPRPARAPWWQWIFAPARIGGVSWAAATVLIVISAGTYLRRPQEPVLSDAAGAGAVVLRSGSLDIIEPRGDLSHAPVALRWQPVSGASQYEVRILEVDRTELWRSNSAATRLTVPERVRSRLVPDKTVLWQVIARDAVGAKIATSDFQRFRVRVP